MKKNWILLAFTLVSIACSKKSNNDDTTAVSTPAYTCVPENDSLLPNPDMESWINDENTTAFRPECWLSTNDTPVGKILNQTVWREAGRNGGYSVKLKSVAPPAAVPGTPVVNGVVTTGNINTTTFLVDGGLTFTHRPDSLVGYYKCNPAQGNGDHATIEMVLKSELGDTIAHARFEGATTEITSFVRFSVPFVYRNASNPSIGTVLLSSSEGNSNEGGKATIGSELWVDDLDLIYN